MEQMSVYLIFVLEWTLLMLPSAVSGISSMYFVNEKNLTWTEANNTCTLAQPTIMYTGDEELLDINISWIPEGGELWVGYVNMVTVFSYLGCWQRNILDDHTIGNFTTRTKPGVCYSACGTETFAISVEGLCKCLDNGLNRSTAVIWSSCNNRCNQFVCGAKTDTTLFSVYQLVSSAKGRTLLGVAPIESDQSLKCLSVSKNQTQSWRKCSKAGKVGIICGYTLNNDMNGTYEVIHKSANWFNQVKACPLYGNQAYGEVLTKISTLEENTYYFTMIVNQYSIFEARDDGHHQRNLTFQYAAVNRSRNLTLRNAQDTRSALCQIEQTATPTTLSVSTAGEHSDTNRPSISQTSITTTPVSGDTASADAENKKGLHAGIGTGVGILIASTMTILIILYIKRRQQFGAAPPKGPENSFVNEQYDYESPSQSQTEPGYTEEPAYSIIEPTKPGGFGNGNGMAEDPSENVYDVSGEDAPRQVPPYEHVYNIADSNENVYDHTNTSGMNVGDTDKSNVVPPDIVYDVSGTDAQGLRMQSDNVYDIGSGMQSDVYNVIDSQPRFQTDNTYDTTNSVQLDGNVYDHTNNGRMTAPNRHRVEAEGYEEWGHALRDGSK